MSENTELPEEIRIFLLESYENLDQLEQDLVQLETNPRDAELINSVFRAIHTVKGNSGFLGLQKLEELCHKTETMLDKVRNGNLSLDEKTTNVLLSAVDATRRLLKSVEDTGEEGDQDISSEVAQISEVLEAP